MPLRLNAALGHTKVPYSTKESSTKMELEVSVVNKFHPEEKNRTFKLLKMLAVSTKAQSLLVIAIAHNGQRVNHSHMFLHSLLMRTNGLRASLRAGKS